MLIRLRVCAGWSTPLLFAYYINRFCHHVPQMQLRFDMYILKTCSEDRQMFTKWLIERLIFDNWLCVRIMTILMFFAYTCAWNLINDVVKFAFMNKSLLTMRCSQTSSTRNLAWTQCPTFHMQTLSLYLPLSLSISLSLSLSFSLVKILWLYDWIIKTQRISQLCTKFGFSAEIFPMAYFG